MLVVDDDSLMRMLFEHLLRRAAVEHVVVSSGDEAAAAARAAPFDVAFVDENLRGETGAEVVARLRADGRAARFVGISGGRDASEPGALGFDGFEPKPVSVDDVVRLLERWL